MDQYGDGWNGVKGNVTGWFYGDPKQFLAEFIGGTTCIIFVFAVMYIFFKVCDKIIGIRSLEADEIKGLDEDEIGLKGYDNEDHPPFEHEKITNLV